jgi:hypothetical protein
MKATIHMNYKFNILEQNNYQLEVLYLQKFPKRKGMKTISDEKESFLSSGHVIMKMFKESSRYSFRRKER